MNQLRPPFDWFKSAEANQREWLPQLNQFGAYCAAAFHRQPERFYYLPNLGGLVTTWDKTTNFAVGDGGMNEGFCSSGPGHYYSEADWRQQMTTLLGLAQRGKILLCQTGTKAAAADHRWFVVTSYLLSKGRHSYLNMFEHSSLEWYPEYDLDLGAYQVEPEATVAAYWNADWKLYRRDYEKGIVLVNPGDKKIKVADLKANYLLVTVEGGGAVGADGKWSEWLEETPVTSVTIPAHSGRVLRFAKA